MNDLVSDVQVYLICEICYPLVFLFNLVKRKILSELFLKKLVDYTYSRYC